MINPCVSCNFKHENDVASVVVLLLSCDFRNPYGVFNDWLLKFSSMRSNLKIVEFRLELYLTQIECERTGCFHVTGTW
jgi:hypothetical protein